MVETHISNIMFGCAPTSLKRCFMGAILVLLTVQTVLGNNALTDLRRSLQEEATIINVCVPFEVDNAFDKCDKALDALDSPAGNLTFRCVAGGTPRGCLKMLEDGSAALAKVPASAAVLGQSYGVEPVVAEYFDDGLGDNTEGYSVALVNSDWCYNQHDGNPGAEDLKDLKACFSGYSSDGGWFAPVGYLMNKGNMTISNEKDTIGDDAESVLAYFDQICAPGNYQMAPKLNGKTLKDMCTLCEDQENCRVSNEWHGLQGSLMCGTVAGDVVFTRYPALDEANGAGTLQAANETPEEPSPPADEYAVDYNPTEYANEEEIYEVPPGPDDTYNAEEAYEAPPITTDEDEDGEKKNDDEKRDDDKKKENDNNKDRRLLQTPISTDALFASKLLFCPQKSPSCQPLSNYKECNFGRIPSQSFLAKKGFIDSEEGSQVIDRLIAGGSNPEFMNKASESGESPYWLISPGTTQLKRVESYDSYMDGDFSDSTRKSIMYANNMGAGSTAEGSSGGLSTGAIIGIVVASIVVAALLVGLIVYWAKKDRSNQGWKQYQDAVRNLERR